MNHTQVLMNHFYDSTKHLDRGLVLYWLHHQGFTGIGGADLDYYLQELVNSLPDLLDNVELYQTAYVLSRGNPAPTQQERSKCP